MTEYVDKLNDRMTELANALMCYREDPDYPFDEVKGVDTIIKFVIYLNDTDESGIVDGIYIYMNEDGIIVNAEYFVKEEEDVTIISFSDEQLELIIELFRDVFTINVE
ncbi:MAG: hypothetical protein BZ136_00745 [Methanosphaera sp. rholeuAM74]|nr:MAG: hypothetical protein BZ136_00745 [Methanosphaera sp. rholeuAM74]